ncbi:MAG: hypothetical protein B6I18_00505 [Bacteroidetes bacterium 4572_112]|nr:MAG: hypothetical protein B6I18_00505 [Bacteroidetes bacterium 4572_112]
MNIQILPNWFKKVALITFIVSYIIVGFDSFIDGVVDGFIGQPYEYSEVAKSQRMLDFVGSKTVLNYLEIVALLSIIAYVITKEKVEDDYIKILRLESYQLSFTIIIFVGIVFILFDKDELFGLFDSITLFLWLYLIIFFINKRKD